MFQSFPLGDKSSVNLRGEFHTENITTFDTIVKTSQEDVMDTEPTEPKDTTEKTPQLAPGEPINEGDTTQAVKEGTSTIAEAIHEKKESDPSKTIDLDALYPIFWGLQGFFSAPTRLFDSENFASFRTGLEKTLSTFKLINTVTDTWSTAKAPDEIRKGLKRKRNSDGVDIASSFNPKYLTSRELFDLEVTPSVICSVLGTYSDPAIL